MCIARQRPKLTRNWISDQLKEKGSGDWGGIKGGRATFPVAIAGGGAIDPPAMPRIPRGQQAGFVYHVINGGNVRATIFHKPQDHFGACSKRSRRLP